MLAAVPPLIAEHGFEGITLDRIVKAAAVRRNAFYEQFENKGDCLAAAYEIAQERLLGAITYQCYTRAGVSERIEGALSAVLELLDAEPSMARMLLLEAPLGGIELIARHHAWLDRYGSMLRFAAIGKEDVMMPSPSIEPAIVGGVVSRLKEALLAEAPKQLAELGPELTSFALSFYGLPVPRRRFTDREPPQLQSSDGDAGIGEPAVA